MYNNPYFNGYAQNINQLNMSEKIDNQIHQLQQMKEQLSKNNNQQPSINQTFQLAPNSNGGIKFVNSVEDVQKELAIMDTPFIKNDYSVLWIKNAKGEIRAFTIEEIKQKDEKDLMIENLQKQVNLLSSQIKEMNNNEQYGKSDDKKFDEYESEQLDEPVKAKTTSNVSNARTSKSKSK